jgi:hypothetical protein
MVALQNLENKEVPYKIFLDKELQDVFGLCRPLSVDRRREEDVPGRLEGKLLRIIVRRSGEIICKHLRCGQTALARQGARGLPGLKIQTWGTHHL